MARRKLEKFADLHSYPNVYEYVYEHEIRPDQIATFRSLQTSEA